MLLRSVQPQCMFTKGFLGLVEDNRQSKGTLSTINLTEWTCTSFVRETKICFLLSTANPYKNVARIFTCERHCRGKYQSQRNEVLSLKVNLYCVHGFTSRNMLHIDIYVSNSWRPVMAIVRVSHSISGHNTADIKYPLQNKATLRWHERSLAKTCWWKSPP